MRALKLFVLALLAGAAMGTQAAPLGADDARYLLTRSGFAPTEAEVRQYAVLSKDDAVDRLLRGARTEASTRPPEWVSEPFERQRPKEMSDADRKLFQQRLAQRGLDLRAWWMGEMLVTPSPLTERMTLFWHNHFVSSLQKVRAPQLMYQQNLLLRHNALGNFGTMLHAVAKDPAMIIYLDSATNRKGQPNENFAREVMELFTLGEGHYTEKDIKEAARAYTGWSLEPETAEFKWRPGIHDDESKTVLGRSGNFDGDAVLDILLAQPAAADFIVKKMWLEFVSPDTETPANQAEIHRIAQQFRNARYDIKTALRAIFTSPRFYAPENRASLIKSPVELVVGTVRQLGIRYDDPLPFVFITNGLGQSLLAPPNVRGWPGGETWINSTTLLARKQFIERMMRVDEIREMASGQATPQGMDAGGDNMRRASLVQAKGIARAGGEERERMQRAVASISFDSRKFLEQYSGAPQDAVIHAVLAGPPANPLASDLTQRQLLKDLLLDPMYQLK
jgi:uncharacterized protein (DUF1800 family)